MKLDTFFKVVTTGSMIGSSLNGQFGGDSKLGSILSAIAAGAGAITKANDEKKAIALAKLAQAHPNADPKKLSAAIDAQIAAMNAMAEIGE